jgi:3-phosphoshikimate 1-carboxyvinyltransferase
LLSENSKIILKNININATRIGLIKILNMMGAKIKFKNIKIMNGEKCSDIEVKSVKKLKSIRCPTYLNSAAIDEFMIIFLVAAKANGISYFKDLSELNQKESPRLKIAARILKNMGVKLRYDDNSIKIYGNPNLELKKKIVIKDFLKDHRIFMMSVISALSFGGEWKIYDPISVKTSFPSFFKKIREIGGIIK